VLTAPAGPANLAEARLAVLASRQRVSATLDRLELRLEEKKDELRRRVDVTRPMRRYVKRKPFKGVGLAVGAGVLLGVLGSSGESSEQDAELGDAEISAIRRWRRERRKRLLETAEDELPGLDLPPSRVGRFFRDMTHELAGAATALVIAALVERVRSAGPAIEPSYPEY
jgi:ElaB/YqjD/DUF883 family membrane-anchored ribosome-binding protein